MLKNWDCSIVWTFITYIPLIPVLLYDDSYEKEYEYSLNSLDISLHLCNAGYKATLTLDTEKEEASVCLKSSLGHIPSIFPQHYGPPPRPHRGLAYRRRQERRKTAQTAAASDS